MEEIISDILKAEKVIQSTVEEAPILGLPLGVLSRLAEVTTWHCGYNKQILGIKSVSRFRLVCKRWNRAAIASFDMWKRLLLEIGPSHIGPNSIHSSPYHYSIRGIARRGDCKKNDAGRCTIAFHYVSSTLEPNYTASTAIAAYGECMRILGKKAVARKKGRIKSMDRQYATYEEKLKTITGNLKRDMKRVKRCRDEFEKSRELDQKVYQTHLKRKRKPKGKPKGNE